MSPVSSFGTGHGRFACMSSSHNLIRPCIMCTSTYPGLESVGHEPKMPEKSAAYKLFWLNYFRVFPCSMPMQHNSACSAGQQAGGPFERCAEAQTPGTVPQSALKPAAEARSPSKCCQPAAGVQSCRYCQCTSQKHDTQRPKLCW